MESLLLAVITVFALYYIYLKNFKKHGCDCASKGCCHKNQQKTTHKTTMHENFNKE